MRIIKLVDRRTKVKLYVLKENGNVVDIQMSDCRRTWHELDGKEYYPNWQTPKDVRDRLVKHESSLTKNYGYEETYPFVFEASFYSSGSGGSSRYTDLLYMREFCVKNRKDLVDHIKKSLGLEREEGWKYENIRVGITVGNIHELFSLCISKPNDFTITKDKNHMVIHGVWEFETNKSVLCIKPYVEK